MAEGAEQVKPRIDESLFDVLVFSAEEGICKPNPEIFQRVLDRLGVSAERTLFIDDRPINIEAAKNFNIHAIFHDNADDTLTLANSLLQAGNSPLK